MNSCQKKYDNIDCSILIDTLVINHQNPTLSNFNECWMIAKPLYKKNLKLIWLRLKACLRILRGKSFAVHYAKDTIKNSEFIFYFN